ncbi:MAG: (Fe-S)-binding protein [Actinobacteria bacterium]|nr:(Fe-S)-binding protein [Actinomycetota bacterium]
MHMEMFKPELCDMCGDCLAQCPVLELSPGLAVDYISRLVDGEYVSEVLDRCTGCMSCDAICSKGAHPYGLLLEWYAERYLASGIPGIFLGAMPQRDGPNLWRGLDRWLTVGERRNLELWSRSPESEEVLFLGCNQHLTPYVADAALFRDVTVFTDPDQCCGEYFLRLGLIDVARRKAASLARRFAELGIRRIIAFCPACHNTMNNLAPLALGVHFDVEIVSMVDWLAARVKRGEIEISAPLSGTVTVQDPCHASGLEPATVENVRGLLEHIGLKVMEMQASGATAECCGLGASLARYHLRDVLRAGVRRMRQTRTPGADMTCAWCNGCYMVMNMFRLFYPIAPPVYQLVELMQTATGEVSNRLPARPAQLLIAATEASVRDGFSFRRVKV